MGLFSFQKQYGTTTATVRSLKQRPFPDGHRWFYSFIYLHGVTKPEHQEAPDTEAMANARSISKVPVSQEYAWIIRQILCVQCCLLIHKTLQQ